jgi:hypothetical protein
MFLKTKNVLRVKGLTELVSNSLIIFGLMITPLTVGIRVGITSRVQAM